MRRFIRIKIQTWLTILAVVNASLSLCGTDVQSLLADDPITVRDIQGNPWTIGGEASEGTVLVIIGTDCPIANSYQPELRRLKLDFAKTALQFLMVHANPTVNTEEAEEHAKQFGIEWPILLDPDQTIARRLKATVVPSAFLVDRRGNIVYRGRIDDRHVALGRKKPAASRSDLRLAVGQYLTGETIEVQESEAVGCRITY